MKIVVLVEGATEIVFIPEVRNFLKLRLGQNMPKIVTDLYDGRVPKEDKLKRRVQYHLSGNDKADAVIALTDVYTGTNDFSDAADAIAKMRQWVGPEPKFHPHAAQHDFEAWLLPYWDTVKKLAGSNRKAPAGRPENVNHNKPPAYHLNETFLAGSKGKRYVKPRDAGRILRGQDLLVAANVCPTLKNFLNTILRLSGSAIL